jgi:hypothetical protein
MTTDPSWEDFDRQCRMSSYLDNVACHEAGHAVIGRVLRLVCGFATIIPNERFLGSAEIADPWAAVDEWTCPDEPDPIPPRLLRAAFRCSIIAVMAGREAEDLLCGLFARGRRL